jgi:DNA-binding NarL/FixJ family response regulator
MQRSMRDGQARGDDEVRRLTRRLHARGVIVLDASGRVAFASPQSEDGFEVLLDGEPPSGDVTRREREVLELVREGLTNAQIGERLVLSTRTIERHLLNVYAKLDVHTRTAAVARAMN